MKTVKFIEGERIYLRPAEEKDAELVYFGKNDSRVRNTLFLFSPVTFEQAASEVSGWSTDKDKALFTICLRENGEPIGQTAFVRIDFVSRAAVFYLAVYAPEHWSKGYSKEAVKLMLSYAFDVLNLNRIQLHVSSENTGAVKIYKEAGYQVEGTLRQAMYHDNRYVDFYVMGILRDEYYTNK